jgi:hypothetical protein
MTYVSYFRAVDWRSDEPHKLSNTFIYCHDRHALMYPERSESVLMVPGSTAQMTQDMIAQDAADLERAACWYPLNT